MKAWWTRLREIRLELEKIADDAGINVLMVAGEDTLYPGESLEGGLVLRFKMRGSVTSEGDYGEAAPLLKGKMLVTGRTGTGFVATDFEDDDCVGGRMK